MPNDNVDATMTFVFFVSLGIVLIGNLVVLVWLHRTNRRVDKLFSSLILRQDRCETEIRKLTHPPVDDLNHALQKYLLCYWRLIYLNRLMKAKEFVSTPEILSEYQELLKDKREKEKKLPNAVAGKLDDVENQLFDALSNFNANLVDEKAIYPNS